MHTLIVVAHPLPGSLTHAVAARIADGIAEAGGDGVEIADLAAEGFDPRFNAQDHAHHRRHAPTPTDVAAEQARIDRADALVLVYPVYWWAMPALMKGWIDRVFSNGWAYEETEGGIVRRLERLTAHMVGVAGSDAEAFDRHGYRAAMRTQQDYGIFGYCGARVGVSEMVYESDSAPLARSLESARALGRRIAGEGSSPRGEAGA